MRFNKKSAALAAGIASLMVASLSYPAEANNGCGMGRGYSGDRSWNRRNFGPRMSARSFGEPYYGQGTLPYYPPAAMALPYGGTNPYLANSTFDANALVAMRDNLANERRWLEERLDGGGLSGAEYRQLEDQLRVVKAQQKQVKNALGLEQDRIQQLLSGGNLNPYQTSSLSNLLSSLTGSGTPVGLGYTGGGVNNGLLNGIRDYLGL